MAHKSFPSTPTNGGVATGVAGAETITGATGTGAAGTVETSVTTSATTRRIAEKKATVIPLSSKKNISFNTNVLKEILRFFISLGRVIWKIIWVAFVLFVIGGFFPTIREEIPSIYQVVDSIVKSIDKLIGFFLN